MFERKIEKTSIEIKADLKYSKILRDFVTEYLTGEGVPKLQVRRLVLVTDELFMNAVRYGSDENSFVRVWVEVGVDGVRIGVEDEGVGRKKIRAKELRGLIEENIVNMKNNQTSGRGIALIVDKWTDGWDVNESRLGGILVSVFVNSDNYIEKKENEEQKPVTIKNTKDYSDMSVKKVNFDGYVDQSVLPKYADEMQQVIENSGNTLFVLNFEKLTYVNSLFIGALAGWLNRAKERGGDIIIIGAQKEVAEILDLCGVFQIISFYVTIGEAKEKLKINI